MTIIYWLMDLYKSINSFMKALSTLSNSIAISEQFYRVLIDSFKVPTTIALGLILYYKYFPTFIPSIYLIYLSGYIVGSICYSRSDQKQVPKDKAAIYQSHKEEEGFPIQPKGIWYIPNHPAISLSCGIYIHLPTYLPIYLSTHLSTHIRSSNNFTQFAAVCLSSRKSWPMIWIHSLNKNKIPLIPLFLL